jgi:1-phosphofructokinase
MIVTFTANPSVDRTAELDALVRGAVLRVSGVRVDAGGKGVNVTRALSANGHPSIAVLPSGGAEGTQLQALLAGEGLRARTVPIAGAVRANITLVEADGTTTKVNEAGPTLAPGELSALTTELLDAARGADWAVLSGSLPPGVPADIYAELTERLHAIGVRVAVDTDGAALRAVLASAPELIKPNRRELAEATGLSVDDTASALAAIERLRADGADGVLASLGRDGAVLVDRSGIHHAVAQAPTPRSTVGAGDALLAGFLAAGASGPAALAEGVAWGTAAVGLAGSRMPHPADIDRAAVQVTSIDASGGPAMTALVTPDLVDLELSAGDRAAATRALADRLAAAGRVSDLDGFLADVAAREAQMPTGLEGGIGIPHARSAHVTEPSLAFGRSTVGVDFGASDGPAHLIFLIAAPAGGDDDHMTILAALARRLVHASFREALLAAADATTAAGFITQEVTGA